MPLGTRKLIETTFLALLDSGIDYRGQNVGCYMSGVDQDMFSVSGHVRIRMFRETRSCSRFSTRTMRRLGVRSRGGRPWSRTGCHTISISVGRRLPLILHAVRRSILHILQCKPCATGSARQPLSAALRSTIGSRSGYSTLKEECFRRTGSASPSTHQRTGKFPGTRYESCF